MDTEKETNEVDLRSAIESAFDKVEAKETPETDNTPEVKSSENVDAEVTQEVALPAPIHQAPASWTSKAKEEWSKIPLNLQEEIIKREKDVARGFEEKGQEANFARSIKETIAPYQERLNQFGSSPKEAIEYLFKMENFSHKDPEGYILHAAQGLGVDLASLAQKAQQYSQQQQGTYNPQLAALERKLAAVEQNLSEEKLSKTQSEIDKFKADKPYYDQLEPLMIALIETGQAPRELQTAYDMALYANPQTRTRILEDQRKTDVERKATEIKAKTDKAKKAAVSLKGAPSGAALGAAPQHNSVRAALEAAWDQSAGGRV